MSTFIRVDHVIERTALSRSAIARLVRKQKLKTMLIGKRQFFLSEDIERFLAERREPYPSGDPALTLAGNGL